MTLGVNMNWNRNDTNWSELKRKAKRQPESGKDYNVNTHKSDLKPHKISIASPEGLNQETDSDQRFSPRNKPKAKQ